MDEALDRLIRISGANRVRDALAQHALRSVRITSQPSDGNYRPGASRLGGLPDLPEGVEWPRLEVVESPLAFLAQINLDEASPSDEDGPLPKQGVLYFFVDPEEYYGFEPADRDRWQVIYSETVPTTGPTPAPEDMDAEAIYGETGMSFCAEWTLPPYESPMVEVLNLTDEETDEYLDAVGETAEHRLLGHPQQIQGFIPYEIAMASRGLFSSGSWDTPEARAARAQYGEWILLLQLDSAWETNRMMWGDVGRLYFYIRKEDLLNRRFDQVWLMMQCS